MGFRVLVVGGGGREHALVSGIARSPLLEALFCAPGNPGMAAEAQLVAVSPENLEGIGALVEREDIDLTVVGPEAPLVAGLADMLVARGRAVFGPARAAAVLEGSKSFAKEIMRSAGVPTGAAARFTLLNPALAFLEDQGAPIVVKADGLAAGKGVVVAQTRQEAEAAIRACLSDRVFGDAGDTVLLEEYLEGEEASLLALVSDDQVLPLEPAQDYKRALDGDQGPNTGGMGSYSPVPSVSGDMYHHIVRTIIQPTVAEMAARGISYRGVLYTGVILTGDGPKVLEFNCRFGDPETQVLIPRLQSDLLELLWATATGGRLPERAQWHAGPCVGVVMASRGYPASSSKGDLIQGVEQADALAGVEVFHAGTALKDGRLVTAGGRVLTVTALGADFAQARARAYEGVRLVSFPGMQWRRDIAQRAMGRG